MMDDEQLRRFIYNLCNYAQEIEVELPTKFEKAIWLGILPSLKINDRKYEERAEKSRENGKLGGAPIGNQNARKFEIIPNNLNQPKQPDKSKEINDNSKMLNEKCEKINENSKMKNVNEKVENKINADLCMNKSICKEIPEEFYNTADKLKKSGWNSLSSKEATIFNKYIDIHNDYMKKICPEDQRTHYTFSKTATIGQFKK